MNSRCALRLLRTSRLLTAVPTCSKSTRPIPSEGKPFGLVLDIDGVLLRGRDVLPRVPDAFRLLTDANGSFQIPTVFLTNGSNSLRAAKAQRLSQNLGIEIRPQQVVMAHSPLRMFTQFHDKHVLVVGQGPVNTIAQNLGFNNVITLDDLRGLFPHLDCVDFSRRRFDELNWSPPKNFAPIDAIVLLGEPLHWESALQFLLDVLITDGDPAGLKYKRGNVTHSNLPLLACNVDMVWMAEKGVNLPRIGHGSFLTCLEAMYSRLMGRDLKYTAVLGKPAEVSYLHATHCLQDMAFDMKRPAPKTIYVIGDNPLSDILGANLYNRYLQHGGRARPPAPIPIRPLSAVSSVAEVYHAPPAEDSSPGPAGAHHPPAGSSAPLAGANPQYSSMRGLAGMAVPHLRFDHIELAKLEEQSPDDKPVEHRVRENIERCLSVLVETGVYLEGCKINGTVLPISKLVQELTDQERTELEMPGFVEPDLFAAVEMILQREQWKRP